MDFFKGLADNQVLISALVGWTVAQLLKTIIDLILNRSFSAERLVGSGGMPSSHSATVCGLTTAAGLVYGVSSFEFAISFVLASVVMYDAMGVRREAGKQAKLLNMILEQDSFRLTNEALQQRLEELIGHTPLQVLAGAALGIALAFAVDGCYA